MLLPVAGCGFPVDKFKVQPFDPSTLRPFDPSTALRAGGGTGLSLQFTILIFHKQYFFDYDFVAKLLGGKNSCLERKLRIEIATKPNTKGRGAQPIALEVLVYPVYR